MMSAIRAMSALAMLLGGVSAFAQTGTGEKNATPEDIQGEWQLVPLPAALQIKLLPSNPWPAECQYFSYAKSGELKTTDKLKAPCAVMSAAQLREAVSNTPAVLSWKYDFSETHKKGILIITRSDRENYMEVWEPHVVDKPFTKEGEEFRAGDLILYLADMQAKELVWVRHLRKLS